MRTRHAAAHKATPTSTAMVPVTSDAPHVGLSDVGLKPTGLRYTAADLDRYVEEVRGFYVAGAAAWIVVGKKLLYADEHKIWKLREKADRHAAYTAFWQWAEREVGIPKARAYEMMKVAKTFTVEQVEHYGKTMLSLVASMPVEMHADLLTDVDAGKLKTLGMKAKVQKHRAETGHVRGDDGAKQTRTHAATAARVEKMAKAKAVNEKAETARLKRAEKGKETPPLKDKVTVASIDGTKTIKLYARPSSMRNIDWKALKRAKGISDAPFGKLELANEVTMFLSVVETNDGWKIIANTRRDNEEPKA